MSIISLSNDVISAQINTLGAELCSLKNTENKDFIWEGDPAYWGKHSPVLFPIVGTLKNNTYTTIILKWETKAWGEIPADFGRK